MSYDQIGMVVKTPQFKLNKEHYDKIIAAKADRKLVYESVLEPNNGDAFYLRPGWVIRLEQRHETVQINDWLWMRPDLKEYGSYANTFLVEGSYLRLYSRVWSSRVACGLWRQWSLMRLRLASRQKDMPITGGTTTAHRSGTMPGIRIWVRMSTHAM